MKRYFKKVIIGLLVCIIAIGNIEVEGFGGKSFISTNKLLEFINNNE